MSVTVGLGSAVARKAHNQHDATRDAQLFDLSLCGWACYDLGVRVYAEARGRPPSLIMSQRHG